MSKSPNDTIFFYQGNKLVTVKEGANHRSIFRATDMPLAEQQSADGNGLLATDNKGSVLAVQSDEKKETHRYSVYGHDPTLPSVQTSTGFNGEIFDAGSSGYALGSGYRTYSASLMRFLATDNLSPFGQGGLNPYCYCQGDPANFTDSSGHVRVYLANGQIMNVGKNMATPVGYWGPRRDKEHQRSLSNLTLQRPRTVPVDNPTGESQTLTKLFEPVRSPSTSTEVVHVKEMDLQTFQRNSEKIEDSINSSNNWGGNKSLKELEPAVDLMSENEQIARVGETLRRKSMTHLELKAPTPSSTNNQIRNSLP
ncbi:RHS repeat-associated core domain-containing protein [Pseudomonas promysalinigenes]|uniref:RHS repeat-associated core domain-containing protein n=1 Tax=Pseudomonas promysalinigenes TaxID=485898 RepID=A0ABY6AS42_9PSED|nr:RHS repeat-associated core domain-containing protein [Pseudomonas promysalinigenes]UXH40330.1 RHS repeat-associated core domain-containing protein [Pseudomonas promysalinigenes]